MYIWIGCKLPEKFEQEIRSFCLARNQQVGLDTAAFSLPQHISLKISFETSREEEILEDLTQFASAQAPFSVRINGIEQMGNILWMTVEENINLQKLHKALDTRLKSRFEVPQHEFDICFQFHSTLFIDSDREKIAQMKALLTDYPFPQLLMVDALILGVSETGRPGTYRVVRKIGLI